MKSVYLFRTETGDQGTFGVWMYPDGQCFSGELPWRENQVGKSCIPAGTYTVQIRVSPKYGRIYWVTDVEGRSWILVHWGNLCGDVDLGFDTHVQGCILLGKAKGTLRGQKAVLNSRLTVKTFMRHMGNKPFRLHVIDPFHQEFAA